MVGIIIMVIIIMYIIINIMRTLMSKLKRNVDLMNEFQNNENSDDEQQNFCSENEFYLHGNEIICISMALEQRLKCGNWEMQAYLVHVYEHNYRLILRTEQVVGHALTSSLYLDPENK